MIQIGRARSHVPAEIEPPDVLLERALAVALPASHPARPAIPRTRTREITRRGVLWLGQTCNLRCHFCYFLDRIEDKSHPEHAFMSLDKAKSICKTLVDYYGNNAVDIQGGEPTIWRDIDNLVRYCAGIGLAPTLITNAIVLDRIDRVKRLVDAGVSDFLVSVQGLGRAHDLAVGLEGAHARQMRALGNLVSLGVPFRFNCVMSKGAVPQLPAIAQLAVATGARAINFLAFNPFADQRNAGVRTADNVPRYREVERPLEEALDVLARAGVEANVRYVPFCLVTERHWPSVYDYQQLSYDPHEWDFASWTWTNKGPQRMNGGMISPPVPLGARPRLGPLRQPLRRLADALDLRRRILEADRDSRIGPWMRRVDGLSRRVLRRRGDREAAYRRDAAARVEHNGYEKGAACRRCALRGICDGFHGDYVAMFGIDEARPIEDRSAVTDPTAFIRRQDKSVPVGVSSSAGGPEPARVDILGVPVARLRFGDLLAHLDRALAAPRGERPAYYTYVNAHGARLAARDPAYRDALTRADVVYADGIGVVWASRLLGAACPERINVGPAELGDLLDRAADRRSPVFVLGGAQGIAEEVARRQLTRRPDLAIAGTHHGYFDDMDGAEVVRAINASGADLLLVGLGPPKQELWIARHLDELRVRACWCIGGLLDQVAGAVPYPPDWVRRNHVQWLYRLAVEPRRLWRRYLLGNPDFIRLVAKQRLG